MPTFTRDVPVDPRGPAFPIIRTPASKPLLAIVTSFDLVGCYTHYYKGRTVPCDGADCEACHAGIPYRWHAYMSAIKREDQLHCLFECTAQAAEHFTTYRNANTSLRGCEFEARRMNSRTNGRIIIRTRTADLSRIVLPKPPDLIKCLGILWGFPADEVTAPHINPENKMKQATHHPKTEPNQ